MIRKYYANERPLPQDVSVVQRLVGARTKEERQAVETVLSEFFTLCEDGWHNSRCDNEISRYKEKQEKARRSANARWDQDSAHSKRNANAMPTECVRIPNAMPTQSEGNALQTPDTRHHIVSASRKTRLPERTTPRASHFEKAKALGLNLVDEVEKFRDYHQAKGTMFADWDAALHSWLRNAVNFRRTNAVVTADPYGLQGAL